MDFLVIDSFMSAFKKTKKPQMKSSFYQSNCQIKTVEFKNKRALQKAEPFMKIHLEVISCSPNR